MTPDFPDPLRKSMSWGVGIILFTRAWILEVGRAMRVDGLPVLLLLANATCCNRAALINTNAKCYFSFKPQCSECCVVNGCPRYLIRYRKRNLSIGIYKLVNCELISNADLICTTTSLSITYLRRLLLGCLALIQNKSG
jgi:hypothetical protein